MDRRRWPCLYLNRLADAVPDILQEIARRTYEATLDAGHRPSC